MQANYHRQVERLLFLAFVALHLFPILGGVFFPSLDGPAHLYNSRILIELGSETNAALGKFYTVNDFFLPNWIGHIFLGLLLLLLPDLMVEKMFIFIYVVAFSYSFRYVCAQISPYSHISSYLCFPLIYSFFIFLGFFNFLIGVIFLLVSIGFTLRHLHVFHRPAKVITYLILVLLCYYSHLFVYIFFCLLISLLIGLLSLKNIIGRTHIESNNRVAFSTMALMFFITSIPLILYMFHSADIIAAGSESFISSKELRDWVLNVRPIIALNFGEEEFYTRVYFLILFGMFVIGIRNFSLGLDRRNLRSLAAVNSRFVKSATDNFLLVLSFITLFLAFILPDSNQMAGYVSVRILFLFFVCMALWLSKFSFSTVGSLAILFSIALISVNLNLYYADEQKKHSEVAELIHEIAEHIEPNSTVLPLNQSNNWFFGHFSNYLGLSKPMIILENYEAHTGYFPLRWNTVNMPNLTLGHVEQQSLPCVSWISNTQNPMQMIDYVIVIGQIDTTDSCMKDIVQILESDYIKVLQNSEATLYSMPPVALVP